jgi:hypothetical protein
VESIPTTLFLDLGYEAAEKTYSIEFPSNMGCHCPGIVFMPSIVHRRIVRRHLERVIANPDMVMLEGPFA